MQSSFVLNEMVVEREHIFEIVGKCFMLEDWARYKKKLHNCNFILFYLVSKSFISDLFFFSFDVCIIKSL